MILVRSECLCSMQNALKCARREFKCYIFTEVYDVTLVHDKTLRSVNPWMNVPKGRTLQRGLGLRAAALESWTLTWTIWGESNCDFRFKGDFSTSCRFALVTIIIILIIIQYGLIQIMTLLSMQRLCHFIYSLHIHFGSKTCRPMTSLHYLTTFY